jgi:BP28CT (NUC211) domain
MDWNQTRVTQLLILRALKTIISALPSLLKQHLVKLLGTILLLPANPLAYNDSALISDYKKLTRTVSSCVPARQLMPAAATIVSSVSAKTSIVSLLSILTDSVKTAKSAEISSHTQHILKVAFHAFEHGSVSDSDEILRAGTDLVVAVVMKQSEVQFCTLFQKLWAWSSERKQKYVLWQLSSSLSKNLKTIFLPCLSTIFEDVVDELVSFGNFIFGSDLQKFYSSLSFFRNYQ